MMLPIVLTCVVLGLLWYFMTRTFSYWRKKGVPYMTGPQPLVGSLWSVVSRKEHIMDFYKRFYSNFENEKFVGFFESSAPAILLRDPDLIKQIMIKDFPHFTDHGFMYVHEDADPLEAKNLFNMNGDPWRQMRAKLTPTFTSGRIKAMFPLIKECADELESYLQGYAKNGREFEAKDMMARYATDVISSCAFGIKCNSIENPNNEFRTMANELLNMNFFARIKFFIVMMMPWVSIKFRLAVINEKITNFFRNMVSEVVKMRAETGKTRKDFMQLLIDLQQKGQLAEIEGDDKIDTKQSDQFTVKNMKLTHDDLTAQATVFFFAGFETSSTMMSYALLELGIHRDLQKKAQEEIDEVLERHGGQITYDALQELKYLDCIMQETLRKYPSASIILRKCTKEYTIPGTNVTVEKDTPLVVPVIALQNDPKYFPNPDNFDPERFRNDETVQKNKFIYMPFGEGPRQCIGMRFAQLKSKLGLFSLLRNFEVEVCSRTNYPVILDPKETFLIAEGGIWIKIISRSQS